jgi:hypothetical protein
MKHSKLFNMIKHNVVFAFRPIFHAFSYFHSTKDSPNPPAKRGEIFRNLQKRGDPLVEVNSSCVVLARLSLIGPTVFQ